MVARRGRGRRVFPFQLRQPVTEKLVIKDFRVQSCQHISTHSLIIFKNKRQFWTEGQVGPYKSVCWTVVKVSSHTHTCSPSSPSPSPPPSFPPSLPLSLSHACTQACTPTHTHTHTHTTTCPPASRGSW